MVCVRQDPKTPRSTVSATDAWYALKDLNRASELRSLRAQVLVHMLKNDLRGYRPLGPRELKLVCRALEYVDLLPDLDFTGCHPPLSPEAVAQVRVAASEGAWSLESLPRAIGR